MGAAAAATNAALAATAASQNAGLSLYNSWGIIEDHDYDFATYGIWGEGQIGKFAYLHSEEIISEKEDTENLYFYG